MDAGADYIITQLFFRCEDYVRFVEECHAIGITVPIIPGICAINSYESMLKFAELSAVPIPPELLRRLEPVRSDQQAVQELGIHYLTDLCRQLLATNLFPGIHFYTLNQSSIMKVIKNCGLWRKYSIIRPLPWRQACNYQRIDESIRPIFWANRPKSYIHRTRQWTEFPTTCWLVNFSMDLDPCLVNFPSYLNSNLSADAKKCLSECESIEQIYILFNHYYSLMNWSTSNHDKNNNDFVNGGKSQLSLPWIDKIDGQHIGLFLLFFLIG